MVGLVGEGCEDLGGFVGVMNSSLVMAGSIVKCRVLKY
jgi:hypothetical protein